MMRVLNEEEQIEITALDAMKLYPKCRFLLVNHRYEDGDAIGTIYAISEEPETSDELIDVENKVSKLGKRTFLGGDYHPNCMFGFLEIEEVIPPDG